MFSWVLQSGQEAMKDLVCALGGWLLFLAHEQGKDEHVPAGFALHGGEAKGALLCCGVVLDAGFRDDSLGVERRLHASVCLSLKASSRSRSV